MPILNISKSLERKICVAERGLKVEHDIITLYILPNYII